MYFLLGFSQFITIIHLEEFGLMNKEEGLNGEREGRREGEKEGGRE